MYFPFQDAFPQVHPTARVAENASIIGAVSLAQDVSVWYGAVLRADESSIVVGEGTNIQDNCVLHAGELGDIVLGKDVTVGHGVILHGCTVEDGSLIGMGAIVMDGSVIGAGSLVAAGALVTKNTIVPPGSLVMGSPAKVARPLSEAEQAANRRAGASYRQGFAAQLPPAGEVRP